MCLPSLAAVPAELTTLLPCLGYSATPATLAKLTAEFRATVPLAVASTIAESSIGELMDQVQLLRDELGLQEAITVR